MAALELNEPISAAIEAMYEARQMPSDHPTLRCSEIGEECERKLWYRLHWALEPKKFSGRILRLFETGHREEQRMIDNLLAICCTISGQQLAIEPLIEGWLTGSIDGMALGIPGAEKTKHLLECKTHSDANWKSWRSNGVRKSHPKHYAQMQAYMSALGLTRALYAAHNKNTDELQFERIEFDPIFALQLENKAERIAFSERAPPKVSVKPDFYLCGMCEFSDLCHGQERARANCRTCLHSAFVPSLGGNLWCDRHSETKEHGQQAGCKNHLYEPSLINGEQIDADDSAETVTYRMPDGTVFVDGRDNK